jgi:lipopolysaccharide assembly outer membrane protein LptD (OstA)
VLLYNEADVQYKQMRIQAEQVDFDLAGQVAVATGSPVLWDGDQKLDGARMTYQLDRKQGAVYEGLTKFEAGIYRGGRICKVEDRTLDVIGAGYTTCDESEPHYHFKSGKMKIYLNDKVVAKPVVFKVGRIPLFVLPYYVFPIKKGRHSGLLVPQAEFGFSTDKGQFIRNAGYYWAINDYADLTAWVDYYGYNNRLITYLEGRYAKRYLLNGSFRASYSNNLGEEGRRWDIKSQHRQEVGEKATLTMRSDFVSDKSYRRDREGYFEERLDQSLRSHLSYSKNWSGANLSATVSRTEHLDTDPDTNPNEIIWEGTLPDVKFRLFRRSIGRKASKPGEKDFLPLLSSMYYSFSTQLASQMVHREDEDVSRRGMANNLSLSNSRKVGWLHLSTSFNYAANVYDKDVFGNTWRTAGVWNSSFSTNATFYRTFLPSLGRLIGIRHVLTPSVGFSYRPNFFQYTYVDPNGVRRSKFSGRLFDINWRRQRALNFSLGNRLQLKLKHKDQVKRLDNFASWNISASYNFENETRKLSPISSQVYIRPGSIVYGDLSHVYDYYDRRTTSLNLTVAAAVTRDQLFGRGKPQNTNGQQSVNEPRRSEPWSVNASFRYSRGIDPKDANYWLDGTTRFSPTRNWRVDYTNHYDLKEKKIVSQEVSFYRDLHCWEARFVRTFSAGRWEYYFKINIKSLPEISYERGTARGASAGQFLSKLTQTGY